jgi:hypothetical protein
MSRPNPLVPCPLESRPVRSTRCTEVLLQRYGVAPDTTLRRIARDNGLSRERLEEICRSCVFNPVEESSDLDAGQEPIHNGAARSKPPGVSR